MQFSDLFTGDRSDNPRVLIVAEIGVNHNGRMDLALELIDRAVASGADAVKFQAFVPERMITRHAPKAQYQLNASPEDEDQFTMLQRLQLTKEQFQTLKQHAETQGILFLASVFDVESVEALRQLAVTAYKIPSGELTNLPLIQCAARLGKPLIISTGMAGLGEVEAAVRTAEATGNRQLLLLHCVSSYPAPYHSLNLRAMVTLAEAFQLPVGYSDHAPGTHAAVAAVALGAVMVEKHFTLAKDLSGPDHQASLVPEEFRRLVEAIRETQVALGDGRKLANRAETELRRLARKSIVAAKPIPAGATIRPEMLTLKRPGTGIAPQYYEMIIGRQAARTIPADGLIAWNDLK